MRILLVEDDHSIAQFVELGLEAFGHQCVIADNGREGLEMAREESVELVILDVWLPELDGHEVLRRIRARRPGLPVLMLTARDDQRSKISALDAGADDYITKPFDFDELLARIRALARRTDQTSSSEVVAGGLRMDLLARRVWCAGERVELSGKEFALLEYFMRHPGQVLSRQQILSAVWGDQFDPASNVVNVHVRQLRRKLGVGGQPSPITTVRGVGYRLEPDR